MMKLPDGWNDYDRVGKRINGTRFIAFKVPLREDVNKRNHVVEEKQLYPKLLMSLLPNLGMVVDLTNTSKYYSPEDILQLGIAYEKINVEGQKVPKKLDSMRFRDAVNKFLQENADNDKLIGVHCTHGLNRTGFIVSRYMIEEMHISPLQAIAAFEIARGHRMERKNYTDFLKTLKHEKIESMAIDTDNDKACQTQPGFWINEQAIRARKRTASQNYEDSFATDIDFDDIGSQRVSLVGCVNIQKADLIPDGRNGFFVHIEKRELRGNDDMATRKMRRLNLKIRDPQNFRPIPQLQPQMQPLPLPHLHSHPHPHPRSHSHSLPQSQPERRQNFRNGRNERKLKPVGNRFPRSNNMSPEDLLHLESMNRQRMNPAPYNRDVFGPQRRF